MSQSTSLIHVYDQLHAQIKNVLEKQFFFVVGCQKSGTTWLEKILDNHPEMICRGEAVFGNVLSPALNQALGAFNEQIKYRNAQLGDHNALMFNQVQLDYLYLTAIGALVSPWIKDKPSVRLIGEKTPEHAMTLPVLNKYFPNSKVVQIIRDGRDVAVSGWFHNLRFSGDKFKQRFPDMPSYIKYLIEHHWIPYINAARAFGRQFPERYFELKYEDLHADAPEVTTRLFTFLGVDATETSVQQCLDAASFKNLAKGRDGGQEDRGSFFRKGVTGDWKNHFDAQSEAVFMQYGGTMLRELGYV